MEFFTFLFDGRFMPHGHCLLWRPDLLFLHVGGDVITGISYFVIPGALIYLVRRRDDLAFDRIFLLFAAFILCCGITHMITALNIWQGYYFIEGGAKLITGLISLITAIMIWRLMPRALAVPSNTELRAKNEALAQAEAQLLEANQFLEQRILERTHELQKAATTDSLTGIHNRGELMKHLDNELERCRRYEEDFCVLMIDMDNFKSINDRYGHQTGDRVLIKAADIFQKACRTTDVVGRYGGEEFLVLVPNTTVDEAHVFAERIRTELEHHEIELENGSRLTTTCSIGITRFQSGIDAEQLLHDADMALYMAKVDGRNTIVIAPNCLS
jgi:diguanylate cyclase (GGDEF)-like protein